MCFSFRENTPSKSTTLSSPVNFEALKSSLISYLTILDSSLKCTAVEDVNFSASHLTASFGKQTEQLYQTGKQSALESFGFTINRTRSKIKDAGNGVTVTSGVIPENHLVALYPGKMSSSIYSCSAVHLIQTPGDLPNLF